MEKFFNIAGPCNPAKHYMLSATARLPEVASLIRKEQYFVIHAQRQCGKTTAILAMRNEIHSARIELAKKLISDGGAHISGLHLRCGFSSPATFRRVFKSFAGVSPQGYRQKSSVFVL